MQHDEKEAHSWPTTHRVASNGGVVFLPRTRKMDARLRAGPTSRVGQVVEVDLDHVAARLEVEQAEAVEGGAPRPLARVEVQRPHLAVERDGDPPPPPG